MIIDSIYVKLGRLSAETVRANAHDFNFTQAQLYASCILCPATQTSPWFQNGLTVNRVNCLKDKRRRRAGRLQTKSHILQTCFQNFLRKSLNKSKNCPFWFSIKFYDFMSAIKLSSSWSWDNLMDFWDNIRPVVPRVDT